MAELTLETQETQAKMDLVKAFEGLQLLDEVARPRPWQRRKRRQLKDRWAEVAENVHEAQKRLERLHLYRQLLHSEPRPHTRTEAQEAILRARQEIVILVLEWREGVYNTIQLVERLRPVADWEHAAFQARLDEMGVERLR